MGALLSKDKVQLKENDITVPHSGKILNVAVVGLPNAERKTLHDILLQDSQLSRNKTLNFIDIGEKKDQCDVFIMVFSLHNRMSWYKLLSIYDEIMKYCSYDSKFIVVGCYNEEQQHKIISSEISSFCYHINDIEPAVYFDINLKQDTDELISYLEAMII